MLLCICDFNRGVSTWIFKIEVFAEGNKELITLITETLCAVLSAHVQGTQRDPASRKMMQNNQERKPSLAFKGFFPLEEGTYFKATLKLTKDESSQAYYVLYIKQYFEVVCTVPSTALQAEALAQDRKFQRMRVLDRVEHENWRTVI